MENSEAKSNMNGNLKAINIVNNSVELGGGGCKPSFFANSGGGNGFYGTFFSVFWKLWHSEQRGYGRSTIFLFEWVSYYGIAEPQ